MTVVTESKLKSIHDLLDEKVDEQYYYTKKKYPIVHELIKDTMNNEDRIYQYRRVYVRENKSNVCPTLTANMGTGGHNVPLVIRYEGKPKTKRYKKYRKFTPEECFRFQGYGKVKLPQELVNGHLYKQAGNSVTVPLVKKLAEIIKISLNN